MLLHFAKEQEGHLLFGVEALGLVRHDPQQRAVFGRRPLRDRDVESARKALVGVIYVVLQQPAAVALRALLERRGDALEKMGEVQLRIEIRAAPLFFEIFGGSVEQRVAVVLRQIVGSPRFGQRRRQRRRGGAFY